MALAPSSTAGMAASFLINALVEAVATVEGAGANVNVALTQKGQVSVTQQVRQVSIADMQSAVHAAICGAVADTPCTTSSLGRRRRELQSSLAVYNFDYSLPVAASAILGPPSIDTSFLATSTGVASSAILVSATVTKTLVELTTYGAVVSSVLNVPSAAATLLGLPVGSVSLVSQPLTMMAPALPPSPQELGVSSSVPPPSAGGVDSTGSLVKGEEAGADSQVLHSGGIIAIGVGAGVVIIAVLLCIAVARFRYEQRKASRKGSYERADDTHASQGRTSDDLVMQHDPATSTTASTTASTLIETPRHSPEPSIVHLERCSENAPNSNADLEATEQGTATVIGEANLAVRAHEPAPSRAASPSADATIAMSPETHMQPTVEQRRSSGEFEEAIVDPDMEDARPEEDTPTREAARALFPSSPTARLGSSMAGSLEALAAMHGENMLMHPSTSSSGSGSPGIVQWPYSPERAIGLRAASAPLGIVGARSGMLPPLPRAPVPQILAVDPLHEAAVPGIVQEANSAALVSSCGPSASTAVDHAAGLAEAIVPDDCTPGQTFQVTFNGRELDICCPDDFLPGDVLEFEVPPDSTSTCGSLSLNSDAPLHV